MLPITAAVRSPMASLAAIALALAPPAFAQESTQPSTFLDTLDVRVIEIEVVVTDGDGRVLAGLERERFRLLVDGRDVAVDYFDERRDGTFVGRAAGRQEGTSFLLFIDDYFTEHRYRGALFKKLLADLDSFQSEDRMAIVRFAGRQLEVVSEWSSSIPELRAALEEARSRKTGELLRRNRMRTTTWSAERLRLSLEQARKSTSAAAAALRSFHQAPGRKAMVLVSTGWPHTPEAHLLADTANLLGYSIYPLHLGSLTSHHRVHAGQRSPGSWSGPRRSEPIWQLSALQALADTTGGRLFAYTAISKRPLDKLAEDTRSYYSLGFSPSWRQNGVRHTIEVVVGGCEGCEVRHRQHFRDLSRAALASMVAESALLLGAEEQALAVRLGEPTRSGLSKAEIPVEISIPMDWATTLPDASGHVTLLELRVAAVDAKGDRSEMPVVPITLRGPEPAPGSEAVYETRLQVRRRSQRLVLSLTDRVSGETLTTTVELGPGAGEADQR